MSAHGTYSRYVQGCRCTACRAANREYHRAYRLRRAHMAAQARQTTQQPRSQEVGTRTP